MPIYETQFTRLRAAKTPEEIVAIRDEAESARIKAHLAGDKQTEALAADIVRRANERLAHRRGRGWLPLSALAKR
jgi:hypothetical protein